MHFSVQIILYSYAIFSVYSRCCTGWITFICCRFNMLGGHPIFFKCIQQLGLMQELNALLLNKQIHRFSRKQGLLYCIFWRSRLYTQDILCILIRIHNALKVLSSFHRVIFIWFCLIALFLTFSCKVQAWHIYHYPSILHIISSLFVYLSSLLMLIRALQTINSNLHFINVKYVQNPIFWVAVFSVLFIFRL